MILTPKAKRSAGRASLRSIRLSGLVVLLLFLGTAFGHGATASQTEVKAAFLYNVAKFVEWPAEAFPSETAPIQLGVFGDEDFAVKLGALLNDKKAHGRSFEVKAFSNPQEAKDFQMVFVAGPENRRLPQVLEAAKKSPVLTIGESEQFLDAGGTIAIFFEDTQLRFEVNPESAQKAKIEISSHLLRLQKKRSPK